MICGGVSAMKVGHGVTTRIKVPKSMPQLLLSMPSGPGRVGDGMAAP